MLTALDSDMKRTRVFLRDEGRPPFFCQVCGEEVEPATTPENVKYWKHKETPCPQWEPDTSEHLRMKHVLSTFIPARLKPELEYPVVDTLLDICLPDLKVNIECQVQPQTLLNIKRRIWKLGRLGYFTLFIWNQGKKTYAKIDELGKQQTYQKLNARLVENLILSQFLTQDEPAASSRAFWDDYDIAARDEYRPRYFMYYANGRFYWLNIIRRYGNRFYSGAVREFDFRDIGVELYKTDIGRLAAFIRKSRPDGQKGLNGS